MAVDMSNHTFSRVVISGIPGIGKSSIIPVLCEDIRRAWGKKNKRSTRKLELYVAREYINEWLDVVYTDPVTGKECIVFEDAVKEDATILDKTTLQCIIIMSEVKKLDDMQKMVDAAANDPAMHGPTPEFSGIDYVMICERMPLESVEVFIRLQTDMNTVVGREDPQKVRLYETFKQLYGTYIMGHEMYSKRMFGNAHHVLLTPLQSGDAAEHLTFWIDASPHTHTPETFEQHAWDVTGSSISNIDLIRARILERARRDGNRGSEYAYYTHMRLMELDLMERSMVCKAYDLGIKNGCKIHDFEIETITEDQLEMIPSVISDMICKRVMEIDFS